MCFICFGWDIFPQIFRIGHSLTVSNSDYTRPPTTATKHAKRNVQSVSMIEKSISIQFNSKQYCSILMLQFLERNKHLKSFKSIWNWMHWRMLCPNVLQMFGNEGKLSKTNVKGKNVEKTTTLKFNRYYNAGKKLTEVQQLSKKRDWSWCHCDCVHNKWLYCYRLPKSKQKKNSLIWKIYIKSFQVVWIPCFEMPQSSLTIHYQFEVFPGRYEHDYLLVFGPFLPSISRLCLLIFQ